MSVIGNPNASSLYLRYLGDPVLERVCRPVESVSDIPDGLLDAMCDIVAHPGSARRRIRDQREGLGLAANQAGVSIAVVLLRLHATERGAANGWVAMANPRITHRSHGTGWLAEGCLSIPGVTIRKRRHYEVWIQYQDVTTLAPQQLPLRGVEAQCAQHELEHLHGLTILDGATRQQRRAAERAVSGTMIERCGSIG